MSTREREARESGTGTAPELVLERTLAAEPERVFAAWTEPGRMRRWFGPEGTEVAEVEADPREGGRWRVVMRSVEDGALHIAVGTYREVRPPERLVTTWAWLKEGRLDGEPGPESLLTVELRPVEGGTHLRLHHGRFADAEARDGHREGWTSALGRLERLAPALEPVETGPLPEESEGAGTPARAPSLAATLGAQLGLVYRTVEVNTEGMSHDESLRQPEAGNCANWILGHLTDVQNDLMGLLGEAPVWDDPSLRRDWTRPVASDDEALEWEALRSAFLGSRDRCLTAVTALTEEALAEDGFPNPFGGTMARGDLLAFLAFHQAYHAGQLALSRRLAGHPGAIRAPGQRGGG